MRVVFWMIMVAGGMMPSTAFAQSFGNAPAVPQYNFDSSYNLSWTVNYERNQGATAVLATLRKLCSSESSRDQYYCARGMKVLNKAYAEYQLRKVAGAIIAD